MPNNDHELAVMANAVEWTHVRGMGRRREVSRHATQAEAVAVAPGDGRSMIYAVDRMGLSVHVKNV